MPILFFIQLTILFIIIYVFCPEKTEDIFSVILYIEGNIPIHKKRRTLYGKKKDDIAYEIEIERSEEMEQEIDHSINQMNDEFRMTRTAAELTDLQGKEE